MMSRVAVIGVGNIGIGAMTDLVLHGIQAVGVDISDEALRRAEEEILRNVRFAPVLSKSLPKMPKSRVLELMTLTTDLAAAGGCDFVIENVTENWSIKRELYERLDRLVPDGVCFGVNTSCISITQVGSVTRRPQDIVGIHLMNPVHLKPTVEVIRGFHTSQRTIDTLLGLFAQLGKQSVIVEDMPGFVSNRISHLFMNEAAFVLQDQVATPEKIDAIFKQCFGHTMGPLETADLIGLDTVMRSLDVLYESYQDSKYRCCPLLRKLVHAGHLGRKTGQGFYTYPAS
ncbi:MAG TPA: 3-hydroxyacyl-CoA dehydrogenase family protein [Steroidobacteraceae bacterium]|nr:3-hydroxyacyl-CoA dehydrogenase family protein [Steroidobacteraceae bacterium]